MKGSAKYVNIVEWSDEDHRYVGSAPGLLYGGCHHDNEKAGFDEFCSVVEEAIEVCLNEGNPMPPAALGRDNANKMQSVG